MSKWTQNLPVTLILYGESEKNGLIMICWPPRFQNGWCLQKTTLNKKMIVFKKIINNKLIFKKNVIFSDIINYKLKNNRTIFDIIYHHPHKWYFLTFWLFDIIYHQPHKWYFLTFWHYFTSLSYGTLLCYFNWSKYQ